MRKVKVSYMKKRLLLRLTGFGILVVSLLILDYTQPMHNTTPAPMDTSTLPQGSQTITNTPSIDSTDAEMSSSHDNALEAGTNKEPLSQTQKNDTNQEIQMENASNNADTKESFAVTILTKEELKTLPAGSILDAKRLGNNFKDIGFYYEPIDEVLTSRIVGVSYKDNSNISLEELRYIRLLHYGFDNQVHIGELIVNAYIAEDIIEIFKELYDANYPIEQMLLVDEFDGDDNASMTANNTSSFNYRTVAGSANLSKHALGLALDINPLYNPYVRNTQEGREVLPLDGTAYADRSLDNIYYIKENDICYKAFIKRGFTWGGGWKSSKDYQHFQKNKP